MHTRRSPAPCINRHLHFSTLYQRMSQGLSVFLFLLNLLPSPKPPTYSAPRPAFLSFALPLMCFLLSAYGFWIFGLFYYLLSLVVTALSAAASQRPHPSLAHPLCVCTAPKDSAAIALSMCVCVWCFCRTLDKCCGTNLKQVRPELCNSLMQLRTPLQTSARGCREVRLGL